jgi:hypothetical protein
MFNLRNLIREVFDSTEIVGPDALIEPVMARIPDECVHEALRQALRSEVRIVMDTRRGSNPLLTSQRASASNDKPWTRPYSWKVDGWREKWLRDQVVVDEDHAWKPLGDCTMSDLLYAATYRRKLASQNNAIADRYENIAAKLKEHGVDSVRELPDDALEELMK